ncbi:MAG: choice-of-anchor Q domain-containing protein [Cyanobacteriota bacterium]|nr:choice-of-anchor Q domain-containing protein [Cyanobacteriota bacterium]
MAAFLLVEAECSGVFNDVFRFSVVLAQLIVTTASDQTDGTAANGLSLREAIWIANANPTTAYTILLSGGLTYALTASGADEEGARTGDLDIASRTTLLTISVTGEERATIDASSLFQSDRVFDVRSGGRLVLENLAITGGAPAGAGGGIRVATSALLYTSNVDISDNNADGSGGGIYSQGLVYLTNGTVVSRNVVGGLSPSGGGIENAGTMVVRDTTIADNQGGDFGGGIYNDSRLTLVNSTIRGNAASTGGGLHNSYSESQSSLFNVTVSGNTASLGGAGGINNEGGLINVINSTITANTHTGILNYAGGISNSRTNGVTIKNSIVAGNIKTDTRVSNSPDLTGSFVGNANNFIGALGTATGSIGQGTDRVGGDPLLAPLADNGGWTLTHALLPGSPAIDGGNNRWWLTDSDDYDSDGDTTERFPTDQRGEDFTRLFGASIDIGALERQPDVVLAPVVSVAVSPARVLEDGAIPLVYTFSRTGATEQPLSVTFTLAGTASLNNDYSVSSAGTLTSMGGTVRFAAGSASASLLLVPTADAQPEEDETILLSLVPGSGYAVASMQPLAASILNDDVILETGGSTKLLRRGDGRAVIEAGFRRQEVTSPWGLTTGGPSSEWEMLAAETVEGVNTILWRNNSARFLHTWTLDGNWAWRSSNGAIPLGSPQSWEMEATFQVDANGDGIIGTPFSTIENRGTTTLLRRPGDDQAFVQVGTGPRTRVTTPWGAPLGTNTSTWQILAADTIAGVNQVLLRNNPGNFLHTWRLDSNWNWTASNGTISPTSAQGIFLLNQFGLG